MKPYLLLLIILFFSATSCSDSNIPNPIIINNENVVFVEENQSIYEAGELLWINIYISSSQEDSDGNSWDIFELTKANETFFAFSLFRVDGDSFTSIEIEENEIIIEKGDLNIIDYGEPANTELLGVAQHNNGIYEMRAGIPLESTGEFFLANPGLRMGTQDMAFNPINGSDIQISLSTKIQGANSQGRYYITVN